jgi:hypothetical protein
VIEHCPRRPEAAAPQHDLNARLGRSDKFWSDDNAWAVHFSEPETAAIRIEPA